MATPYAKMTPEQKARVAIENERYIEVVGSVQRAYMKLDLGAGKGVKEGFTPVDSIKFTDATIVADLRKKWPWEDSSVEEVNASHVLEHFERRERVHFMNELHRVLVKDGKATIVTPHWASNRAYGDMTHCWPPVSEMFWYYLDKNWRKGNCPHDDVEFSPDGYSCDFAATWGYSTNPDLHVRAAEYQQHAIQYYKEAVLDMVTTLVARKE